MHKQSCKCIKLAGLACCTCLPHLIVPKKEERVIPVCSYSVVQVREALAVPTKSSDLEQYLDISSQ